MQTAEAKRDVRPDLEMLFWDTQETIRPSPTGPPSPARSTSRRTPAADARPLRRDGLSLDRWLEIYRDGYGEDQGYRPGDWEAFVRPALVKVWESVAEGGDDA